MICLKCHSYGNLFFLVKYFSNISFFLFKINLFFNFDQLISFCSYSNGIFFLRIFNRDATEAFNCLNGIRCFSFYVFSKIKCSKIKICVGGNIYFVYKKGFNIFILCKKYSNFLMFFFYRYLFFRNLFGNYQLNFYLVKNFYFNIFCLGNYHILFICNISDKFINFSRYLNNFNFSNLFISYHQIFLYIFNYICFYFYIIGYNISFFNLLSNIVFTFERGSGITKSCGSGTFSSCVNYCIFVSLNFFRLCSYFGTLCFFNFNNLFFIKGKCYLLGYLFLNF
ncbi:MAG: hypothetical protein AAYR31_00080 [Candidatus Vidania fulgoroideorum]